MTENWQPTKNQRMRAERSRALLVERMVPMWGDATKCLYVEDDAGAKLRSPQDVARRAMVLWALTLRADGIDQEECQEIISALDLWPAVSPEEKTFLHDPDPDPELARSLVWRLEAAWVLLWALGHIKDLPWPAGMCDVQTIGDVLSPNESEQRFIDEAKLIPASTILDAQDLTLKIHWAIRDAYIKGLGLPVDLDWRNAERLPISACPSVGVVEQRHHVLNWIVSSDSSENWDNIDTPT